MSSDQLAGPAAPAPEPEPTGIDKILVEQFGYEFIGGVAYAPTQRLNQLQVVMGQHPAPGDGPATPGTWASSGSDGPALQVVMGQQLQVVMGQQLQVVMGQQLQVVMGRRLQVVMDQQLQVVMGQQLQV